MESDLSDEPDLSENAKEREFVERILLRIAVWSIDFEAVSATPQTGFNRAIIAFFRL